MDFKVVKRYETVETTRDIYMNGTLIPQGTKFIIWGASDQIQVKVLAGFTANLVLGITLKRVDAWEFVNLPLECLQLIER